MNSLTANISCTASKSSNNKDSTLGLNETTSGFVSITLNNNDSIYSEIRDLSIQQLGSYLQEKAITIRQKYAAFRDNKVIIISHRNYYF